MILKGQKRKHRPEDVEDLDRDSPTWESQRQFVFSVSLSKYQRSQELPEPSLRRSVLITNTLRQISLEASRPPSMDIEVSQPPCSSSHAEECDGMSTVEKHCPAFEDSCPVSSNYLPDCSVSRSPPSCHSSESDVLMTAEDEDWGSMSTDPDFSLSAAISSILTALDSTIDGSPPASPRTPLRSLENLSGPSEANAAWVKPRGYANWEEQEQCRVRESSTEVMKSSYLGELAVEDLFQDIDAFLLETDVGVIGLRSSSGGGVGGYPGGDDLFKHLTPFSSSSSHNFSRSHNPNLKCLPSFSSFSPLTSSSASLSSQTSNSFSSQNHVREAFEMDHLMEILVES